MKMTVNLGVTGIKDVTITTNAATSDILATVKPTSLLSLKASANWEEKKRLNTIEETDMETERQTEKQCWNLF